MWHVQTNEVTYLFTFNQLLSVEFNSISAKYILNGKNETK